MYCYLYGAKRQCGGGPAPHAFVEAAAGLEAVSGRPTRQTGGKTQYPSQPALQKYLHWGLAQMPTGLRPQKDHVNVQWDVHAHVCACVCVCVQWQSGY